jgi:hypothetical protein
MSGTAEVRAAAPKGTAKLSRNRAIAVWTLVVVATLLMLVSSLTVWVKRQALDTDAWVDVSGQMLANDEIRGQLSIYLVDTLFSSGDATTRLQQALPPDQAALAPVIAGALREVAVRLANQLLQSPRVQNLWEEVNRLAHENLLAVLNGEDVRRFKTEDGSVVLDLHPLVEQLASRLGVSENVSPDAGRIKILSSGQLKNAQRSLKAIKALSVILLLVVLFLYALAIYLARGHRRRILRASAVSFVIVGLLLLVIRRVAGNAVVNSIVKTDSIRPAGHDAWLIGTELLRTIAIAITIYGLIALIGAWLAGPTRPAVAARRWLAPHFRDQRWLMYGIVAGAFLLVIAWGPTGATREWLGILILAALLGFGVEVLRRQTLAEFPATKS